MRKIYLQWSWVLMVLFLLAGLLHPVFGLTALLCIIPALIAGYRDGKKTFCTFYCPRGTFLARFFQNLTFRKKTPRLFNTGWFRFLFFAVMFGLFLTAIARSDGSAPAVGFIFFRFIVTSTVVGILLGMFFGKRIWCQICPFGYATGLAARAGRRAEAIKTTPAGQGVVEREQI